jgi:starch synthase
MQVLFVASECAPFVKTGGLADVVSALPKALQAQGLRVRVLLPAYRALRPLLDAGAELAALDLRPGGRVRLVGIEAEGLELILLDAPALYDRPGNPYVGGEGRDWPDNHLRFGTLAAAGATIARTGLAGWRPDLLHAHDWQAALAPAYLHFAGAREVATVTTIHNVAFQGVFPAATIAELGLPHAEFRIEGYEYHGAVSFLKAGLLWSDRLTTVSPTYARELMAPEFGLGLEGVLAARRAVFSGILNGVDLETWDPERDPALPRTYGPRSLARRQANRTALQERFGIAPAPGAPLFCVISRLTRQKGIDLLLEALPRLLGRGAALAVLGSGDRDLQDGLEAAAAAHPERVGVQVGYDEALSHLMQGGADSILVPSRFEPCGLTQLYGLRYGCLPLVARTGGLADSVIDANEAALAAGAATGFQFAPVTAANLADAVDRACDAFADTALWQAMMRRAMRRPVGWETSAAAYAALYAAARAPSSAA